MQWFDCKVFKRGQTLENTGMATVNKEKITRDHLYFWAPSFVLLTSISLVSGCLMMSPFSPDVHGNFSRHQNFNAWQWLFVPPYKSSSTKTRVTSLLRVMKPCMHCLQCLLLCLCHCLHNRPKVYFNNAMPSAACKMTPATCFVLEITNVSMPGIGMRILALQGFFHWTTKNVSGAWFLDKNFSQLLIIDFRRLNAQSSALPNL